jgi:hypothetical protein
VRIETLLAPGAARKMGSTPLSSVITVPTPVLPEVERISTASPL